MALIVEAVGKTGIVERIAVEGGGAVINAQPGLTYRILDGNGRQVNANATVRRVGDHLIIEGLPEEATVQLTDFFFVCTPNDPCALDLEGLGGARGETISQISEPIAAMADGSFVLHAPASMATPVAPESEFSAKPALAGLALLAVGGGGGGGGSGGDGPPPPPPGSTTVTSARFTNDSTPVITGTAVPGSQITITLDIPGSGPVTFNTIADGNGDWSVDTGAATPSAGTMPAGGIPEGAPTTVRVLTAGSTAVVSYQLAIDRVPPDAPVIDQPIAGDNAVNADEAADGVVVSGTAESGSSVAVTWDGVTRSATATGGSWSITFPSTDFGPAANQINDGSHTISAIATDPAGNVSTAGTRTVSVDTAAPAPPQINDVAGDNAVNADEAADGVVVSGTAESGSTVAVTWDGVTRSATATGGSWSITFPSTDFGPAANQINDGSHTISAIATDPAGNVSTAGTRTVSVDTAAPAPPQINDVAGDNVIDSGEASSAITVSGTAEVGSSVVVTWDGVIRNTTATDGTWSVNFETVPAEGDYEIRATATDQAGNVSEPRTLMVTVDFSDASGDGGGAFALMSIDFAIPEFELDGMRSLSIDRLVDDSNGAPGNVVASGGLAGDSTPVLTISLSDLMGDGESIRLMRNGVPVASTSDPGASWNLGDDLANAPAGQYSYTAELVSGGNVLATSESYMYNFQVV